MVKKTAVKKTAAGRKSAVKKSVNHGQNSRNSAARPTQAKVRA